MSILCSDFATLGLVKIPTVQGPESGEYSTHFINLSNILNTLQDLPYCCFLVVIYAKE